MKNYDKTSLISGGIGANRSSEFNAAHSAYEAAHTDWLSQKPTDDTNGEGWMAWAASQPLAHTFMRPVAIAAQAARQAAASVRRG